MKNMRHELENYNDFCFVGIMIIHPSYFFNFNTFTIHICLLFGGAVCLNEYPFASFFAIFVYAFLDVAVSLFKYSLSDKFSSLRIELGNVALLDRLRLNYSMLSLFFSLNERAHLQYFLIFVDHEANTVWHEDFFKWQNLTPV